LERSAVPSCLRVVQPPKHRKPYRLFQIVDTPESSKTILNAPLTAIPKQTKRTLVKLSPYQPKPPLDPTGSAPVAIRHHEQPVMLYVRELIGKAAPK
jgi:hypothetical protein